MKRTALSGINRVPMAKPTENPIMDRPVYDGAELRPYQGRPRANDALALPSRMGSRLHYRDGRVEKA